MTKSNLRNLKNQEFLMVSKLVLVFFIFAIPKIIFADPLVRSMEVSEDDFQNYLKANKQFNSFKDYFMSKNDYLDYNLSQLFIQTEQETDKPKQKLLIDAIYKNLGQSFLSTQKRKLWLSTLELEHSDQGINNENTFRKQIFAIENKSNLFEQTENSTFFKLSEFKIEEDSDLYINGWLINKEERERIILNNSFFYHFLILSNQKVPYIRIEKPSELNLKREDLINGSCENAKLNKAIDELRGKEIYALFAHNCIYSASDFKGEQISTEFNKLDAGDNTGFKKNWRQSPYTYGGIAIGLALLLNYTELRNYRIRINLPF